MYGDVSSHTPLTPAMPSLSHYHCSKAVQTRTCSNFPQREISVWAKIEAFSFCLSLFCSHPPTAEQLFHSFRCKSSKHLPIGGISPYPVSLNKTTFAFLIFAQNNKRSDYHNRLSCTKFFVVLKYFPHYYIPKNCSRYAEI